MSVDENSPHRADVVLNSSRSKSSNRVRRKSSYDEQQSKTRNLIMDSSSSLSSSAEDGDGDNEGHCPVKTTSQSKPMPGRTPSNDSAKSEDSSLSSSEEEEYIPASRRRLPSGTTLKKVVEKEQKPKKCTTQAVQRSSDNTDSESDKSDAESLVLRRNKPVVTAKGSRPTPQSRTTCRTENLKPNNRKEKLRRFTLFSSSSDSSSSESSDEEAKRVVAVVSPISKKRDDQLALARKHAREKTASVVVTSKEKLRSPSNAVVTPLFSRKCDESMRKKERRNSVQKSFKTCESKKTVLSVVGNGGGINGRPVDRNIRAGHVFEQKEKRDKMSKKRRKSGLLSDESEELDCLKVAFGVRNETQKDRVTKNFSRTDYISTDEESDGEIRFPCTKLSADDQKDVTNRNGTRVRDSDDEAVADLVPGLADGTTEPNLNKGGWDLGHELLLSGRSSGQPHVSTDGTRMEDVTKSSSVSSRLDNIFEKMEQNDGRVDRVLACVDEQPLVMEKGADDTEEDQQPEPKEEKVGKCKWELKRQEKELSIAEDVKSLLSEAGCDSDSSSDLGYEIEYERAPPPCVNVSDKQPEMMDKKEDLIEESIGVKVELSNIELAKDETIDQSQNPVTTSDDEFTGTEGGNVVTTRDDTKAYCKRDEESSDEAPGMFDSEEALGELTAAIENLIEKELEPDREVLEPDRKELEPDRKELEPDSEELEPSSKEQEPSSEEPEPCEEEEEEQVEQVHVDLKYAQEKEQLGLDEDTAEEFVVEDVTIVTLDSITERRDNLVNRVTTADRPVDCPYPLPSFLNMFVWVKPVEPLQEIKPPEKEEEEDMSSDIKEPVDPPAIEIPVETGGTTPEQQEVGCEILPDEGEIKKESLDESTSEIKKYTLEEKKTKVESSCVEGKDNEVDDKVLTAPLEEGSGSGPPSFEDEKAPSEKGSPEVESVCHTPPENTTSPEHDKPDVDPLKNGSRRLAGRNGSKRKTTVGGDKSGGMPATPKGVILRTRLQGNVQIVESFSSRGRKIIPKERDVDFMQPGSKCPGKSGAANALGGGAGGCGRGRGRKGRLPVSVDIRPGKKTEYDGTVVDKTRDQTEVAEETSLRPLMQRKLLAQDVGRAWKKDFGTAYRGKRVESLRSNDNQISAKETATLTIARKYGRSTARGRCLKSDVGSSKSLVIQLDKIAVPSGFTNLGGKEGARRLTVGKAKKEDKANSVKDLYEFEDEDEVGPIPEYTHKRPLKRVKDKEATTPTDTTKTDVRTDDDEAESQPPLPKRPKRMVKGRTRGRQARSSKLSQRKTRGGRVTRSKPVEVNPVLTNESSVSSGGAGPENGADAVPAKDAQVCMSDDQKTPTTSEPRHLPLKLEMKEQRQAAAACAAALSNRKDPAVMVATAVAATELLSKPAVETGPVDEIQSNMEKVINEVARGNFDRGNTMSSDEAAQTMSDLPVIQQTVVPLRIIRSASVASDNPSSPHRYQMTITG